MSAESALHDLVARVGAFHITDRAMLRAQHAMQRTLSTQAVDSEARENYLRAVARYFSAFESEARAHLRDVDRRLEALNQVQFNLGAERAVAVKRIEVTSALLHDANAAGSTIS